MEDLITHGLTALRETLQQDKDLTPLNTSIAVIGPVSALEPTPAQPRKGAFRIIEGDDVKVFLDRLPEKALPGGGGTTARGGGAAGGTSASESVAAQGQDDPDLAGGEPAPAPATTGDEDVQMQD